MDFDQDSRLLHIAYPLAEPIAFLFFNQLVKCENRYIEQ